MSLPTVVLVPDYAALSAASINDALAQLRDSVNALTPEMLKIPAYNELHLDNLILPAAVGGVLKVEDGTTVIHGYTQPYVTFGENGNRVPIVGSVPWQLIWAPTISLGMANPARVGAILVLVNANFVQTVNIPGPPRSIPMICLQYLDATVTWNTIPRTERMQSLRLSTSALDATTEQDISIAVLLTEVDIPVPFAGLRVVTAVVNPAGASTVYYREGSMSILPLHCKVLT